MKSSYFDLSGKTAVITGGNGGIGLAIADALAEHGANILIAGRKEDKNVRAVEQVSAHGTQVAAARCDVTVEADLLALLETAERDFGGVDVLVNNAGAPAGGPVVQTDAETWERAYRVNVVGMASALRIFGPHLMERSHPTSVINVASIWGLKAPRGTAAYAATKAAVITLTKVAALEWCKAGVRVNALAPGLIRTEMTAFLDEPATYERFVRGIPMKRAAEPREVAAAALYLAAEQASSYVTGQVIVVDGGVLAR